MRIRVSNRDRIRVRVLVRVTGEIKWKTIKANDGCERK